MKQSTSTKTILIVAIAIVLLSASASGHDSQVVAVGAVVDDSPTTTTRDSSGRQGPREPFIPTHEWQEVDSETPLPPGLHYEIDMTTGRKRAKLLDEEDRGGATVSVKEPSISVVTKEELASRFGHIDDATLARDMEAAGMVNVVNGTVPMEGQRTLEELKAVMEELESNDVFVRDDIVSMRKCIQVILSAGATEDDINDAFLDLEDLVHQVDNGGDLDTLGGLEPLVRLIAARTTSDRLVASAALVLGSAAQSNAKVQQQAIGYGAMEALVGRVEDGKSSVLVTKRSLYALSALVRHSTEGQRQFVEGGVLEALSKAWERVGSAGRAGERVRVRMLGLIGDVLGEAVERLPEADGRRTMRQVVRGEWCGRVAVLLNGVEASYDVRDKALEFVSQALVPCLARFGGVQSDVRRTLVTMSARVERDEGTRGDDGMEALEYELAGRAVALLREMDVFCEKTGSC